MIRLVGPNQPHPTIAAAELEHRPQIGHLGRVQQRAHIRRFRSRIRVRVVMPVQSVEIFRHSAPAR